MLETFEVPTEIGVESWMSTLLFQNSAAYFLDSAPNPTRYLSRGRELNVYVPSDRVFTLFS
jgi:hypothetical protein